MEPTVTATPGAPAKRHSRLTTMIACPNVRRSLAFSLLRAIRRRARSGGWMIIAGIEGRAGETGAANVHQPGSRRNPALQVAVGRKATVWPRGLTQEPGTTG